MFKESDKIIGIIPARYNSTRYPGKPLVKILNKPMIQWVYENASKSKLMNKIYVATDDKRIFDTVLGFGGKAIITSKKHKSGTDRIGEAIQKLDGDIIVNIQGDEPFISAKDIDRAIHTLKINKNLNVATLATKFLDIKDLYNKNKVKVVFDKNLNALYFSRSIIPFNNIYEKNQKTFKVNDNQYVNILLKNYFLHIGLYVYRRNFLLKFIKMKQSKLEKLEKLEQLRILENGEEIKIIISKNYSYSIDTPEDLKTILRKIKNKQIETN